MAQPVGGTRHSSSVPFVFLVVGTLLAVYLLGVTAVRYSPPGSDVSAWWPAAGVAVGAMAVSVTWKQRAWVLAAIAVAAFFANLHGGRAVGISFVFAAVNLANPLVAVAVFTSAWRRRPRLELPEDLWRLFLGAFCGAAVTGVLGGATVALLQDGDWWLIARAVFASHATAIIIIVPSVFVVPRGIRPRRTLETAAQAGVLVACILLIFSRGQVLPLTILVIPVLMWAAVRFSARIVTVELLVAGVMTSVLTTMGRGPLGETVVSQELAPETTGTLLQILLGTYAIVTLTLLLTTMSREASASRTEAVNALLESVMGAATHTLVVACDPRGRVEAYNAGAERLLGWSAAEVVGRATPEQWVDRKETRRRAAQLGVTPGFDVLVAPLRQGASSDKRDWTMVRRDGSRFTCSLRVSSRLSPSGDVVGYLFMGEDVTGVRRAETVMQEALWREHRTVERLKELDRSKSALVATVSHELRTPITSVIGYTDMLLDGDAGDLTEAQRRLARPVSRNGRRLLGLVQDLLTMAQLGAGFQLNPVATDLRTSIERAREALQSSLNGRDLTMRVFVPPRPVTVLGDPDHLERVVLNLLTNALKFTPDGGEVTLRLSSEEAEAHIEVADTGVGIPASEVDKVFEKFFRSSTTLEGAIPGTGLGLAIVKDLVVAHGGTIRCRSRVGQGTTFTVDLPLLESERSVPTPAEDGPDKSEPTPSRPLLQASDDHS
jgi:PAS domain S-box-containing protein